MGKRARVADGFVAGLVKDFGGRYKLAAVAGIPPQTVYAAEKRERAAGTARIASAEVCLRLARAWAVRHVKVRGFSEELAMARRLAGLEP